MTATSVRDQFEPLRRATYDRYRDALHRMAELNMAEYAATALDAFPNARFIDFAWSDQGDWMNPYRILDAHGTTLSEDAEELEDITADLGEINEGAWASFFTDESTGTGFHFQDDRRFDIGAFLTAYKDNPEVPTP